MFEALLNCLFKKTGPFLIFQVKKKIVAIQQLEREILAILLPSSSLPPLAAKMQFVVFNPNLANLVYKHVLKGFQIHFCCLFFIIWPLDGKKRFKRLRANLCNLTISTSKFCKKETLKNIANHNSTFQSVVIPISKILSDNTLD